MKAGEGVIARWTVDPARWEWFRHHSKKWDKCEGWRPNFADLDQTPGPSGIEIVVTGDCIPIGGNFHSFEKNVIVQSHPDWIGFHYAIVKADGPPLLVDIRIPLAPGGQPEADRIVQAYRQARSPKMSGGVIMIYMLLGIVVGLALLTGLIGLLANYLKLDL